MKFLARTPALVSFAIALSTTSLLAGPDFKKAVVDLQEEDLPRNIISGEISLTPDAHVHSSDSFPSQTRKLKNGFGDQSALHENVEFAHRFKLAEHWYFR